MRFLATLTLCLFGFLAQAQYVFLEDTPLYRFDIPNSIWQNEVQDIYEDSDGFIWIASKGGLLRYDGHNFVTYAHSVLDSTSISNNAVEKVFEDSNGNFWIGTWGGGLNKMDRRTGKFERFMATEEMGNTVSNNYIADIVEDRNGHIWLATRVGLNRLDPKTGTFKHFLPQPGNPTSITSIEIRTLFVDQQQTLWVGTGYPWEETTDGGLCQYHYNTETFTRYTAQPGNSNALQSNKITALYEDSKNNFWIGTDDNHLHLLDRKTGKITYKKELSKFDLVQEESQIRCFMELKPGNLWIGSYGSGLKMYDIEKDKTIHHIYNDAKEDKDHFPLNYLWEIYRSSDGTVWTYTGDVGEVAFKSNYLMPQVDQFWEGDKIVSFHQNEIGDFWRGRQLNGINRFNLTDWSRSRTYFSEDVKNYKRGNCSIGNSSPQNNFFDGVTTMEEDKDFDLWMGKKDDPAGLIRLNADQDELKVYKHNPVDHNSPRSNYILDLIVHPDQQRLFFITDDGNLQIFNKSTNTFRSLSEELQLDKNFSFCKIFKNENILHLGGIEKNRKVVYTKIDLNTLKATHFTVMEISRADTLFSITNIFKDAQNDLIIGTDRSISKMQSNGIFKTYFLPEDYLGQIVSMTADDRTGCWMATTVGVLVFNFEDESFFPYRTGALLKTLPFSDHVADKLDTGEIVFGGSGGILMMNKETIDAYYARDNDTTVIDASRVVLTAFYLNGEEMTDGKYSIDNILTERSVTLDHLNNNFSFEMSLLDFNSPEENTYEYYLENYDNYWRTTGDKNMAYYSQIPPGNYRLLVKARSSTGKLAEAIPLNIKIMPPWYRTTWAYLLYALAIGLIIWGIYRFQLKKRLSDAENKRLQEMDAAKTQLYTNITHEFRTPLTVILGMAKQMEGRVTESQNKMVEMITRNGQNLLTLVNQMLDLSKLESGQMLLQLQHNDLISYLKYLTESFHSFAESRQVKIHFLSDLEKEYMDFDPQKIQQIFSNLLSNAIKFTPSGNDIYISVKPASDKENTIAIRVKDTGIGIQPERLPHIFERFYQADDSNTKSFQGTGIGLALVHELVKLMEGNITVKSELNKGTEFKVLLPVRKNIAPTNDLDYLEEVDNHFYREPLSTDLQAAPIRDMEDGEKPTLLIVEDNFDVRTYIHACLAEDYNLIMAENGQRGVDKAIEHIPDLMISDVMMPQKDGYALVRELKNDNRTSHIPIILLTAKADTDSRLQGIQEGVDAYLSKPFNPKELKLRVQKLLELRSQLQAYYRSAIDESAPKISRSELKSAVEDAFVGKVRAVIEENLDNYDLNVEMLCREIGMSHSQLHRKLSALTGLSTNRFIRHIRLSKAKVLLKDPEMTITAVAFDTGFSDPGYFGRVFKKETGMTPLEWQQRKMMEETGRHEA